MLSNPEPAYQIREAYGRTLYATGRDYMPSYVTRTDGYGRDFSESRGPFARAKRAEIAAARAEDRYANRTLDPILTFAGPPRQRGQAQRDRSGPLAPHLRTTPRRFGMALASR